MNAEFASRTGKGRTFKLKLEIVIALFGVAMIGSTIVGYFIKKGYTEGSKEVSDAYHYEQVEENTGRIIAVEGEIVNVKKSVVDVEKEQIKMNGSMENIQTGITAIQKQNEKIINKLIE